VDPATTDRYDNANKTMDEINRGRSEKYQ